MERERGNGAHVGGIAHMLYVTSELTAEPARNDGRRAGGGLLGRREGPRPGSKGGCRLPWVFLG